MSAVGDRLSTGFLVIPQALDAARVHGLEWSRLTEGEQTELILHVAEDACPTCSPSSEVA